MDLRKPAHSKIFVLNIFLDSWLLQRIANKQSNWKSLVIVYRKNRLLGRTPTQLVCWTQVKTIKKEQILIKYDLRRVLGLGIQKKKNLLPIKKTWLARVLKQRHSG